MDEPSDEALLLRWRAGDERAGSRLFDRHARALYWFFHTKVGDEAADLVQECFLACVHSRDDFEGRASFRSYLFAIARNHLLNWLQRDRPKADAVEIGVTSIRDLRTSITGVMDREDRHRRLIAALHRLPLDLQIALELFYFDGLRGHELAEVLGIPHPTVRSRLRRARELLAEAMAAESLDPAEFTELGADLRKKSGSS